MGPVSVPGAGLSYVVSAQVTMDCGAGDVVNDTRPGFHLDLPSSGSAPPPGGQSELLGSPLFQNVLDVHHLPSLPFPCFSECSSLFPPPVISLLSRGAWFFPGSLSPIKQVPWAQVGFLFPLWQAWAALPSSVSGVSPSAGLGYERSHSCACLG